MTAQQNLWRVKRKFDTTNELDNHETQYLIDALDNAIATLTRIDSAIENSERNMRVRNAERILMEWAEYRSMERLWYQPD